MSKVCIIENKTKAILWRPKKYQITQTHTDCVHRTNKYIKNPFLRICIAELDFVIWWNGIRLSIAHDFAVPSTIRPNPTNFKRNIVAMLGHHKLAAAQPQIYFVEYIGAELKVHNAYLWHLREFEERVWSKRSCYTTRVHIPLAKKEIKKVFEIVLITICVCTPHNMAHFPNCSDRDKAMPKGFWLYWPDSYLYQY